MFRRSCHCSTKPRSQPGTAERLLLSVSVHRPEPLEAVEDQVKPEREFDIVIAPTETSLVADREGELGDIRVCAGNLRATSAISGPALLVAESSYRS